MRKSMLILLLAWWLVAPTWGAELPREVRDALPAAAEEITEELEDPASLSEGLSRLWDRALGYVEEAVRQHFTGALLGKGVLLAELGSLIYGVEGVANCRLTAPTADLAAAATVLPVLGTVTITEMEG